MKIQNISNVNFNFSFTKSNKTQFFSSNKLTNDTFTFKGKVLSYDELKPLKLRAFQIQNESIKHKRDSQMVIEDAYESLGEAKNEFVQALKYCNAYKKNIAKPFIDLPNGNTLNIKFQVRNENLTLEMEELTPDEVPVKTISAVDFKPVKIINFDDENRVDLFEYRGDTVVTTRNLSTDAENFGNCEAVYTFKNGKLQNASLDGHLGSFPSSFDKTYVFLDDNLLICSCGNIINEDKSCLTEERFSYIGPSMSNYYSGFTGKINGEMSWDESFHFNKGKFIGSIDNGIQYGRDHDVLSRSATFLNDDNEFIHTTKLRAKVSDFGIPVFIDCE